MAKDAELPSEGETAHLTTAMLKAMAHPLRRQIMHLIRRRDFLRAADVAGEIGIPANSASFHLRVLGDAELIVEAPEQARDRRDRVWTVRKGALALGGPRNPVQDEDLAKATVGMIAEEHQELVRRVLAWSPDYVTGRDPEVHGTFQQSVLRLSFAEFETLMEKITRLIQDAESAHSVDDPDARHWQIDLVAADDLI